GEPAHLPGYGTVAAGWVRSLIGELLRRGVDGACRVWLRRLFTSPTTGQLVQMDSRRRQVPAGLARFIGTRAQSCRTPWRESPVPHRDHVVPHAEGGTTSAENLQGYCEACNYTKQAPGWQTRTAPRDGPDGHVVQLTTPTGHRYESRAPALPGHGSGPPPPQEEPRGECRRARLRPLPRRLTGRGPARARGPPLRGDMVGAVSSEVSQRLAAVRERVAAAARVVDRDPAEVQLLLAVKT